MHTTCFLVGTAISNFSSFKWNEFQAYRFFTVFHSNSFTYECVLTFGIVRDNCTCVLLVTYKVLSNYRDFSKPALFIEVSVQQNFSIRKCVCLAHSYARK